ncbi:MAG: hypothetical protein ACUVX8_08490 [Candidatus Zipacnadales bacterium]
MSYLLALTLLACSSIVPCQPNVANRCVLWGAAILQDGSRSTRFAPEPVPDGPYYMHYIVTLNGDESAILTEMAPKWDPREDVNIPGNGYWGCELGNFAEPEARPGDKVQIVLTDEFARQQGTAEAVVPSLPGAINIDVHLKPAPIYVPKVELRGDVLSWDRAAPTTLLYRRSRFDRYANGKPRGQYILAQRFTGGETSCEVDNTHDSAWMIVQKDAEGNILGRSREMRTFRERDGFDSLIAVTESGTICTADVGAGIITIRQPNGARICTFELPENFFPTRLNARDERIYVSEGTRVNIYSLDGELIGGDVEARATPPFRHALVTFPRGRVRLSSRREAIVDGAEPRIVITDNQRVVRTFEGLAFGGLRRPREVALYNQELYILDGPRIVVVPCECNEEIPTVVRKGNQQVVIWETSHPTPSILTLYGQGIEVQFGSEKLTRRHAVTIGDLPQPGKYRIRVTHSIRVIGPQPEWDAVDLLIPPFRKGYHPYLCVKVAIVICANTGQRKDFPDGIPWPGPVSDAEIERLKQEVLRGQFFYWINSHLRFFPQLDFIVDREFRDIDPYEDYPSREKLGDLFARAGRSLDDYTGVCRLAVEQRYDTHAKAWRIAGGGGGLTSGLSKGSKDPGWSWWPTCAEDYFIPDSWLFTHEYGHQVDAMFEASGEPSFWGNHFAPQEGNVARFGEHFDGNAYLLRLWPEEKWFTSDWGIVEFAADADEDGVPDDAPELPLDEKRFGSDPSTPDTDDDGLADREEAMAWNGIVSGLGQVWAYPILPNPRNKDTDGDGKVDGEDPNPLYPIPEVIPHGRLLLAKPLDWPLFHVLEIQEVCANTSLGWDSDNLYIGAELNTARRILIQLDADNNGWFVGRDNYQLTIDLPSKEAAPQVHVTVLNCAEPEKWPFNDDTLVKPEDIRYEVASAGSYVIVIAIPRSETTGLELELGERLGLNVGYEHPTRRATYLMLFEPHDLVPLELGKTQIPKR